jgi:hypothetical protein
LVVIENIAVRAHFIPAVYYVLTHISRVYMRLVAHRPTQRPAVEQAVNNSPNPCAKNTTADNRRHCWTNPVTEEHHCGLTDI